MSDLHTLVRGNLAGHFKLINNIDATASTGVAGGEFYNGGAGWNPLGDAGTNFTGFFDGNGKTITGLKIDRSAEDYIGLFGIIGSGAVVKDLTLDGVNITGSTNVAGLIGQNFGTVLNCHVTGSSTVDGGDGNDDDDIGGLVGDNDGWIDGSSSAGIIHGLYDVGGLVGDNDMIITNSYSSATVYGCQKGDIGGLVGDNKGFKVSVPLGERPERGTITNCYATGNVLSEDTVGGPAAGDIGGLVGDNKGGTISSSYSTGNVDGKQPDIGGFVGDNKQGDNEIGELKDSIISNCYALGDVTPVGNLPAEGDCGGFVGGNQEGQVVNCYCANAVNITGGVNDREDKGDFCGDNTDGVISNSYYNTDLASIGSSDGGTGKTTAQLKQQTTFVSWDFDDVWTIVEDTSYPTLPASVSFLGGSVIDVYPISHTGERALSADVRPKLVAGMRIHVVKTPDGLYFTPTIIQDYNFPVDTDDIVNRAVTKVKLSDSNGNDINGFGLSWDGDDKIYVDLTDAVDEVTVGWDNPRAYVSSETYSEGQKVSYSGINYVSLQNSNTNKTPNSEPTWWGSIASQKVLVLENRIAGDGLSWSAKDRLQVNQGEGLDIGGEGQLVVDITEIDFTIIVDEITVGFDNPDAHSATKTYSADQKVSYSGVNYVSLQDANLNKTPDSEPTWWGDIGNQKVFRVENDSIGKLKLGNLAGNDIMGDGMSWSATEKIQVNQGAGLDIDGDGKLVVDLTEVILTAQVFELALNKASDNDLTSEFGASGTSGQGENAIFGQAFDPNVNKAIVWSGYVPPDYSNGTDIVIKCRWCLAANGDVGVTAWRWYSVWNKVDFEDASVIGAETTSGETDETVPAAEPQRTMHTITLATINSLDVGDLFSVGLVRNAAHVNDSCTKKIMVLDKIWAEYTAAKLSVYPDTFTEGSILFADVNGALSEDNSNLFWDATNNRLGIGVTDPDAKLEIVGTLHVSDIVTFDNTLTVDNITINGAMITSNTGIISFGDENLNTTGFIQTSNIFIAGNPVGSRTQLGFGLLNHLGALDFTIMLTNSNQDMLLTINDGGVSKALVKLDADIATVKIAEDLFVNETHIEGKGLTLQGSGTTTAQRGGLICWAPGQIGIAGYSFANTTRWCLNITKPSSISDVGVASINFITGAFECAGGNFNVDSSGNIAQIGIGRTFESEKYKLTVIGGLAVKLTNKTGSNTVAGQLVVASTITDDAFATAGASSDVVIGIVLDNGIADGSEAWVVESGIADVLIDAGGSTHGDRIISSVTAGSADVWNIGGAVATHFLEIGHCLETRVGAGLARVKLHFN